MEVSADPMKTAIIVHGAPNHDEVLDPGVPAASNHHWLPWLQKQLIVRGYEAHTPEIPKSCDPEYSIWQREFERFDITHETLLVGHSCGAGFLVRWLSENRHVRVARLVLVAPWIDPDRTRTTDFFDFEMDPEIAYRTHGLHIFNSDNDMETVQTTVAILREHLHQVQYREFHNYGHFCIEDMGGVEFPELFQTLVEGL